MALHIPKGNQAERCVEDNRGNKALVNGVVYLLRKSRRRRFRQCGEPQFGERHAGEVEVVDASDFLLAVNRLDVLAWIQLEAASGFLKQVFALAEQNGAGRTDTGAGRRPVLLQKSAFAEIAFDNLRQRPVPLEFGNVERTGNLAVAAADAGVLVVADNTGISLRCRSACLS